jgi:hypothetical protein
LSALAKGAVFHQIGETGLHTLKLDQPMENTYQALPLLQGQTQRFSLQEENAHVFITLHIPLKIAHFCTSYLKNMHFYQFA